MQGPGSSGSSLPVKMIFGRGSASGDTGIQSQMSWTSMQTSVENCEPENIQHVGPLGPNGEWCFGEASSSSSQHQGDQSERKGPQEEQSGQSSILSLDSDDENSIGNHHITCGPFPLRSSIPNAITQDLNMVSEFNVQESDDDGCQVVDRPASHVLIGPSNEPRRSTGSSSDSFGVDGRGMSCKRKAVEPMGESSRAGSSTHSENDENIVDSSLEQGNRRLRLGVGGSVSAMPFSLNPSRNVESSPRNFRLRINDVYQQDPIPEDPFPTATDVGNVDASRFSPRLIHNHFLAMRNCPSPPHAPAVPGHHHSSWSGALNSRSSWPFASATFEDMNAMPFGESTSRNIPRSISEEPVFVSATEIGSSSQNPTNVNLSNGNNSITGNGTPTSWTGPSTGQNSSAPSLSHPNNPLYPRRLSEVVRRSLLSSAWSDSRDASRQHDVPSSAFVFPQELLPQSEYDSFVHRLLCSSALVGRHLDPAFRNPNMLRTLAAAGEGTSSNSSIMSEQIRRVFDLMQRGEDLSAEDVRILNQYVLFEIAEMHDRHRHMRLNVDGMSYEELVALGDSIGYVNVGLDEETIESCLKRKEYVDKGDDDSSEADICPICREDYQAGEDIGTLECGHEYHAECIKKWLKLKNSCPICKATGLHT